MRVALERNIGALMLVYEIPDSIEEGFNGAGERKIYPTMDRAFWRLCMSLQAI